MKTRIVTSLVVGIALSALAPATWARGGGGGGGFHGGGVGGGGFRGGGGFHGGGGFRGGGFNGGRAFAGGAGFAAPMRSIPSSGFRAAGVSGRSRVGANIPHYARTQRSAVASSPRPMAQSNVARAGARQNLSSARARQQTTARQTGARSANGRQAGVTRLSGAKGLTGHVAERHQASWHNDWDRRHPHYDRDARRFFVFDNGFWWGLDAGLYPWDYFPYYTYDYYPYDYVVGNDDSVPAQYQGTGNTPPAADRTVTTVQTQLTQQGYYKGPVDGLFGPTTRDALARYQTDKGLNVTGSLSADTLQSFGFTASAASN